MDIIEYTADMGRINITADMLMALSGLPIEEQLKFFAIETVKAATGADGVSGGSIMTPLEKCYAVKCAIVYKGVIVGVEFVGRFGRVFGFLNEYCNIEHSTYFDEKNSQSHSTDCVLRWRDNNDE